MAASNRSSVFSTRVKWALCACGLAGICTTVAALANDPPVEVRAAGGGHEFVNRLPYPVVVLLQGRSGDAKELTAATSMVIPAESASRIALKGTPLMTNMEPVRATLPRRAHSGSCTAQTFTNVDPAEVERRLRSTELEGTPEAEARVRVAWELAQLQLEQRRDEKDTYRNDPLRNHLKRKQDMLEAGMTLTPVERGLRNMNRPNEALNEVVEDVTDLALAWATVEDAKLDVLARQADALKEILEQAEMAVKIKKQDIARVRMYTDAGRQFGGQAFTALDAQTQPGAHAVEIVGAPRKVCGGVSGDEDKVEFSIATPRVHGVLLGEARFDRGGSTKLVLRRVAGSEKWLTTIYWPIDATRAQFKVRLPGQKDWTSVKGEISAERPSMSVQLSNAEAAAGKIRKNMKQTRFRAGGGDRIKTIPIGG